MGLNASEMERNDVLKEWAVLDLNETPDVGRAAWSGGGGSGEKAGDGAGGGRREMQFKAITCAVSIDYMIHPLELCRNLLDATTPGGTIHLVISNRCFPNKVVRRWMELDECQRLEFVGDYLWFAGWRDVQIVDLCATDEMGSRVTDDRGEVLGRSKYLPRHLDPLWVVRATKVTEQ